MEVILCTSDTTYAALVAVELLLVLIVKQPTLQTCVHAKPDATVDTMSS